jgi:hypothetical protein
LNATKLLLKCGKSTRCTRNHKKIERLTGQDVTTSQERLQQQEKATNEGKKKQKNKSIKQQPHSRSNSCKTEK